MEDYHDYQEESSLLDCLFEVDEQLLFGSSLSSVEEDADTSRTAQRSESFGKKPELPVFNCNQQRSNAGELSADGFIKTGVLERLLCNSSPYLGAFDEPVTPLCGHMTVTCQVLFDDLNVTFLRFRRRFNSIVNQMSNPTINDNTSTSSFKDCVTFLHFIDYQTAKLTHLDDDTNKPHPLLIKIINNIITHLNNIIILLYPLDQFLSSSMEMSSQPFHLFLHLLWCNISVLYRIVLYTANSLEGTGGHLTTIVEFCDQIIKLFLKVSSLHFDQHNTSTIFHCPCVKEVWLLVVTVTDKLSANFNTQCFWTILSRTVSETDSLPFAWWAIVQVSNLYQYDLQGTEINTDNNKEKSINGDWSIVQDLVTKTIKFQTNSTCESDLRWCLNRLLYVYNTWSTPSLTPVVLLWGYYHKHFNNSYQLSGLGVTSSLSIDNLTCVYWYKHISNVLCRRASIADHDGRTSYEMFLQILYACLKDDLHGNQLWRQMKSRLYSKFSQRKVLDLGLQGVCHLITLYLVLIHVTETDEPAVQLNSLLFSQRLSSDNRSQLLWKGIFALLMTCTDRGVALPETIVTKIAANMTDVQLQPSLSCVVDNNIVTTILQGLFHLVDMKRGVVPWTLPLYGTSFIANVISCEVTFDKANSFVLDMLNLLSGQLTTLTNHSNTLAEKSMKNFSRLFWDKIYHPIIKLLDTPSSNCHATLAETFGTMTQFACTWIDFEEGHKIFRRVGLSDSTSPELVVAYLIFTLNETTTCDSIITITNVEYSLCHSWLRCLFILGASHQLVMRLTTSLINLDSLKELIGEHVTMGDISDPITLFLLIIKGVANRYSSTSILDDKYIWKQRLAVILGDNYCNYFESMTSSTSNLKLYYRVSSAVVRHCAGLIYSKSSARCILPQILDTLVLPVTSRKPLPIGMTLLIKNHLHHVRMNAGRTGTRLWVLFLCGLFTLEIDEFINRKIKQIFSRYFRTYAEPPLPIMGGVASHINPFITFLSPAFVNTPTHDSSEMFMTCLRIIILQELSFPQEPQLMIPCLLFLNLLLSKLSSINLLLKCVPLILERLLFCLLLCTRAQQSSNLHRETQKCLTTFMVACCSNHDKLPISRLLPLIREYLVMNIIDYKQDVFKPLVTITTNCPSLSSGIVDLSLSVIKEYELKKGSGVDKGLRHAHEDFKRSINQKLIKTN